MDTHIFSPAKRTRYPQYASTSQFVVGTVKSLSPVYQINLIIEALAKVVEDHPEIPIVARIAGTGPQREDLVDLALRLGVNNRISWLGFINQEQAAFEWASMDVAIIPSRQESFGVAAIEAQACGTPVVVSSAGGLMEVTEPGLTSIVISGNDANEIACAIVELYQNNDKRDKMALAGRERIIENYAIDICFNHIYELFASVKIKDD